MILKRVAAASPTLLLLLLPVILLSLCAPAPVGATRVRGSLSHNHTSGDFTWKILAKFGVKEGQSVIAYGNVTSNKHFIAIDSGMILAFVPKKVWDTFYEKVKHVEGSRRCSYVMSAFNSSIWNLYDCPESSGQDDYLRVVPCYGGVCSNQPNRPGDLVPGSSLTYQLNSAPRTEFWYMLFVGCYRNDTSNPCVWATSKSSSFSYDISIVNSENSPNFVKKHNIFRYQFPYDTQGLLLTYMVFMSCYVVLVLFHFVFHSPLFNTSQHVMHSLTKLFTLSLLSDALHVGLFLIHYGLYAQSGVGIEPIKYAGYFVNHFSDWVLILVMVLMAKGWQLTTCNVRWKKITLSVWVVYLFFSLIYFVYQVLCGQLYQLWTSGLQPYQSIPGGFYLACRVAILFYVLYELRMVYLQENDTVKLRLYRFFGLLFLLWFSYLPVVAFISAFVSSLERLKTVEIFSLSVDLLANLVLVVLMCPLWSDYYFQFKSHLNIIARTRTGKQLKQFDQPYGSL